MPLVPQHGDGDDAGQKSPEQEEGQPPGVASPECVEKLQEPDGGKRILRHHPGARQGRGALRVLASVAEQAPEPVPVVADVILDEGNVGDLPQQDIERTGRHEHQGYREGRCGAGGALDGCWRGLGQARTPWNSGIAGNAGREAPREDSTSAPASGGRCSIP